MSICLSVYPSVRPLKYSKCCERILMKFLERWELAQGIVSSILVAIWIEHDLDPVIFLGNLYLRTFAIPVIERKG